MIVNTSELGKSFKRSSIWSNKEGVAGRVELRAGFLAGFWSHSLVQGWWRWGDGQRAKCETWMCTHPPFGACWAQPEHCSLTLVQWEIADGRDLEKLVSFENKSPSLLQIIYVYFWRGKSNQAAKNSIAMTSWWCLAYSRRLPCV